MTFRAIAAAAGLALAAGLAGAAERTVAPGDSLAAAIEAAAPGDVIRLAAGLHRGPIVVDRPMTLEGAPGAVIEGSGEGSVVTVDAPEVTFRGLTIRGSGRVLSEEGSGVFVGKRGHRALIEGNRLEGNLCGIYLWGPEDATARGNVIVGLSDRPYSELGSGVSVWNSPGSRVIGNDILHGRDGIYATTSRNNLFRDNRMRDLRFAVHYMYTNDSEVIGNVSVGNDVGCAIMFSHRLRVRDNLSLGDRDYGLLFNYANRSVVEGNAVRAGGDKCVFIYNANFNRLRGNWFEGCAIGVHLTAGSERNEILGNAFVGNRTQVKYVGTRKLDWAGEAGGNYWSDNPAFDLDGDGLADAAYRPNDVIDRVLWRNPRAELLVTSPAVRTIRWAQDALPTLRPGGIVDTAPLQRPPEVPALRRDPEAPPGAGG